MATDPTGIRIPEAEKAEINRRAQAAGLSLTRYMINAALGRLEPESDRLAAIEKRLDALEQKESPDSAGLSRGR